jgi:hypothetical protein
MSTTSGVNTARKSSPGLAFDRASVRTFVPSRLSLERLGGAAFLISVTWMASDAT